MASSFFSSWPDRNSPFLSKIDFGVPLAELLKWLDVRDTFLGRNERKQDIAKALALARECKHPDAVWLTSIFEGKKTAAREQAREVFFLFANDSRALSFAWALGGGKRDELSLIRRAAEMGYAFACSLLCGYCEEDEERFRCAVIAAGQHERGGYYWLGLCFHSGIGCERDVDKAREAFFLSAELGDVFAARDYGNLLNELNPASWMWLIRAAVRGSPELFLSRFSKHVEQFFSGTGSASIVFLAGLALKGNIDEKQMKFFGTSLDFNSLIGPATQAVSFYDSQIQSAYLAVEAWTLIAIRLELIMDVRILIGKMIWEGRFEANYKI